ncbi:MAG: nicotinate (nicotinamide) nucleotide adenylyltransferase [Armatimonadetes bacterium]|nr:nicotinate (nicotinamide) nucleotide adenylyltransferase [Armatimonadota bacterium]
MAQRIGVYGGTFDPPHVAHLILAERAREHLGLVRVVFVPCGTPALKPAAAAPPEHRLAMLRLAVADRPEFAVDDLELRRDGLSYTVDTLRAIAVAAPGAQHWLILGADAVRDFERWREPAEILRLARLAVALRYGVDPAESTATLSEASRARVDPVPMPRLEIASSDVRAEVAAGRSIRYLVPDTVAAYIAKHRLYRDA